MATAREVLSQSRQQALDMVQRLGVDRMRQILLEAEMDLQRRLVRYGPRGKVTFTQENLQTALIQVRDVLNQLNLGIRDVLLDGAVAAADKATQGTIDYLTQADSRFRGVGTSSLALDEASMFEQARVGARSSILRRLISSGEGAPGAPAEEHPAKQGLLKRYGTAVIGDFEQVMRTGIVARKSWDEMQTDIVKKSSFLQGKPAFWAERVVRTEAMGAYARGAWEATRQADDDLGDMVKILSATFDDRTASDSYAVHGQIRRPDEAFESWFGLYQHPPNRPNDREIVVPHRLSWQRPGYLMPKTDAEIAARWHQEKRKGTPPARPRMSTVPESAFGKPPPKLDEARRGRGKIPPEE